MRKQMKVFAFDFNGPAHLSAGLWRHERDRSERYKDLRAWVEYARKLEDACFDGIFFADNDGYHEKYNGSVDAALRDAAQIPANDPAYLVPAMAAATKHLGFGVTVNTTYEQPYLHARRMSTLDHLTNGRIGWNIVTGYLDSAARGMGLPEQLDHDHRYDIALAGESCDYIGDYASPFAMLVIADLLGVPESDHAEFTTALLTRTGTIGSSGGDALKHSPLQFLYDKFADYISDRRAHPRDDVLTGVASARFPDGSTPEVIDAVRVAANLFAAGQETTVRLLSTAVMMLAEDPALQTRLRTHRELIPGFLEETLRYESPIRGDFRLSKVPTTVGGVDIPAGSIQMLNNAAANRDPRRYRDPDTFDPERPNARTHIAFGRGAHTCPGAPLARAEARISLERLFDRTRDIRIDEDVHGPADARRYRYLPTFILRGVTRLHLRCDPARHWP